MTRINVDSKMRTDPRFHVAAALLGRSVHEVRDRVLDVWFACADHRSETIPARWVDIAAGLDGFGEALVKADLAKHAEPDHLRIAGVEERIRYLKDLAAKAKAGGSRSGEVRASKRGKRTVRAGGSVGFDSVEANASHERNPLSLALSLSPDPALSQIPPNPPLGGSRSPGKRGAKPDIAPEAFKQAATVLETLGGYSGVRYTVSPVHARLIASRLAEGLTVLDLRKVAWYCARVLQWGEPPEPGKTDMRRFLRPETLYGPQTIARYLDAARSEYRARFKTDADVSKEEEDNGSGGA